MTWLNHILKEGEKKWDLSWQCVASASWGLIFIFHMTSFRTKKGKSSIWNGTCVAKYGFPVEGFFHYRRCNRFPWLFFLKSVINSRYTQSIPRRVVSEQHKLEKGSNSYCQSFLVKCKMCTSQQNSLALCQP